MYEDDDPVIKRNPKQTSQLPQSIPIIHTFLSVTHEQYFKDSHLSQEFLSNKINSLTSKVDDSPHTMDSSHFNAMSQTPITPTSTQYLPYSTPPFSLIVKLLKIFSSHPIHF